MTIEQVSFDEEVDDDFEVVTDENYPGQYRVEGAYIERVHMLIVMLMMIMMMMGDDDDDDDDDEVDDDDGEVDDHDTDDDNIITPL